MLFIDVTLWCSSSMLTGTHSARLEGFFKVIPKTQEELATLKRKNDEKIAEKKKKAKVDAKAKKDMKKAPRGAS